MLKSKTNDKKVMKIYAIGVIVIALLFGIVSLMVFNKPAKAEVSGNTAVNLSLSESALNKIMGALGLIQPEAPVEAIGAVASPDMPFNYFGVGGLREHRFGSGSLAQGTTTICSFAPDFGTTTLRTFGMAWNIASTAATRIVFAKATNNTTASSTVYWETAIGAGISGTIHVTATTTSTGLDHQYVFGPNDTLNISLEGGDVGTDALGLTPTGNCSAIFEVNI